MGQWRKKGFSEAEFTFNQSMPDEHLAIQGEVMCSPNHYSLLFSCLKKPMKEALEEEFFNTGGVTAVELLTRNLTPASYQDLQKLFRHFSDSIIEFSSYEINVGDLRGRNTVIWEVRNY